MVTNMPTPYRVPVYRLCALDLGVSCFRVIFFTKREDNRQWSVQTQGFDGVFLSKAPKDLKDGLNYRHNDWGIFKQLTEYDPQVVIITGMNPTHLFAMIWAKLHGRAVAYMTDGWDWYESFKGVRAQLSHSRLPRQISTWLMWSALRRGFTPLFSVGIHASKGGRRRLLDIGFKTNEVFWSPLCSVTGQSSNREMTRRKYSLGFIGRFVEQKNPSLFIDVCIGLSKLVSGFKVLLIGTGPLHNAEVKRLEDSNVSFDSLEFIEPNQISEYYANIQVLAFPSRWDAWGVVANDAMSMGTPVATSPFTGCANDLVIHGRNGLVIPLEPQAWIESIHGILVNEGKWNELSNAAIEDVKAYSFEQAAAGICEAVRYSVKHA